MVDQRHLQLTAFNCSHWIFDLPVFQHYLTSFNDVVNLEKRFFYSPENLAISLTATEETIPSCTFSEAAIRFNTAVTACDGISVPKLRAANALKERPDTRTDGDKFFALQNRPTSARAAGFGLRHTSGNSQQCQGHRRR